MHSGLKEIASRRQVNLSDLVASIDSQRQHGNLSSALRLFVLEFYRVSDTHDRGVLHETLARPTRWS
jgi:predicted DNA-binding ribbon-helix-helix protein